MNRLKIDMISEHKNRFENLAGVDWIFWLDIEKWNNALVIQNKNSQSYDHVRLYFKNVYFSTGANFVESNNPFNDGKFQKTKFDLIFCADLGAQFAGDAEKIRKSLYRMSKILSSNGNIVIAYSQGFKLVSKVVEKLLPAEMSAGQSRDRNDIWYRSPARVLFDFISKNRFSQTHQLLFVYPSHKNAWTISNAKLFAAKINIWKKRSGSGSLLLSLISSKIGSYALKLLWPFRILIISKIT